MIPRGTYRYTVREYTDPNAFPPRWRIVNRKLRVEILETTDTQYRVRFLGFHADKRGPGTITKVKRTSVVIDAPDTPPNITPTGTDYPAPRLPYKDND